MNNQNKKLLNWTLLALFCALSAVLARIQFFQTVALDALPAFLCSFLMGGAYGAAAGAAGHLCSALATGFPLTLPLHLFIAAEMAVICFITGFLVHKLRCPVFLSAAAGFVLNGFVSPLILIVWPGNGMKAFLLYLPALAIGSAVNAFAAAALAAPLKKPYARIAGKSIPQSKKGGRP